MINYTHRDVEVLLREAYKQHIEEILEDIKNSPWHTFDSKTLKDYLRELKKKWEAKLK